MAKSNKQAVTFEIGNRVLAVLPSISPSSLVGTIEAVSGKGWFKVRLDETLEAVGVKDGCVSALGRSLALYVEPIAAVAKAEETESDPDPETNRDFEAGETDEEAEAEETEGSKMAQALAKARTHYTKCRRPNGAATAHSGDEIAKALHDYEPTEVAALADKALDVPSGTHFLRYGHLNNGQIRMNSGNRIRSAYLKALKEQDAATIARICGALGLETAEEETEETE